MKTVEDKLDVIIDKINDVEKVQIKQEENLKEHMRRTDMLEKKLEPVEHHVSRVNGAFKLLGVIGLIATIYKAFS